MTRKPKIKNIFLISGTYKNAFCIAETDIYDNEDVQIQS